MRRWIWRLLADRSGSNVMEYGLILCLISLTVIFAASSVADQLRGIFDYLAGRLLDVASSL